MSYQRLNLTKNAVADQQPKTVTNTSSTTHPTLQLQADIGNRAVSQLIEAGSIPSGTEKLKPAKPMFRGLSQELTKSWQHGTQIQPKLTIGQPRDKYEQEADQVASEVVSSINIAKGETVQQQERLNNSSKVLQMDSPSPQISGLGQQLGIGGLTTSANMEASINQVRGSGQPLTDSVREPMEQAFGADFSGVRVHTDAKSDELNQSVQATAFTTGQDIFFRQGAYQPGNQGGQELIAHELTHVVQQSREMVEGMHGNECIVQRGGVEIHTKGSGVNRKIVSSTVERLDKYSLLGTAKGGHTTAHRAIQDMILRVLRPGEILTQAAQNLLKVADTVMRMPGAGKGLNLQEELATGDQKVEKFWDIQSDLFFAQDAVNAALHNNDYERMYESILHLANQILKYRNFLVYTNIERGKGENQKNEAYYAGRLWWLETDEKRTAVATSPTKPTKEEAIEYLWRLLDFTTVTDIIEYDAMAPDIHIPGAKLDTDEEKLTAIGELLSQHVISMYLAYPSVCQAVVFKNSFEEFKKLYEKESHASNLQPKEWTKIQEVVSSQVSDSKVG